MRHSPPIRRQAPLDEGDGGGGVYCKADSARGDRVSRVHSFQFCVACFEHGGWRFRSLGLVTLPAIMIRFVASMAPAFRARVAKGGSQVGRVIDPTRT